MPRVTFNRLSKKKSTVRRRRTSVIKRAKFQAPTARNQKKQIMGNALAIRSIRRLMPPPVYTDYQYGGTLFATFDPASPSAFSNSLLSVQLMSPALWNPVLRQDVNVVESSTTKILRMQLNLRYALGESSYAQFTTFVVTIRPDAVNRVINAAGLDVGQDYIYSTSQNFNVRLNPSVFKVHYVRNVSLTKNGWLDGTTSVGGAPASFNPQTTMAKGQVNMKLNMRIKQPVLGTSWTAMTQAQLGPSQRYFLITFVNQIASNPSGPTEIARLDFDNLYTCFNAA